MNGGDNNIDELKKDLKSLEQVINNPEEGLKKYVQSIVSRTIVALENKNGDNDNSEDGPKSPGKAEESPIDSSATDTGDGKKWDELNEKFQEELKKTLKRIARLPHIFFRRKKARKYFFQVLPHAEYIDSKIPEFSKKWNSVRNEYYGLKSLACLAYIELEDKTPEAKTPEAKTPEDQTQEGQTQEDQNQNDQK